MISILFSVSLLARAQMPTFDLKPGAERWRLGGKFQADDVTEQVDGSLALPIVQGERQTFALAAKARHVSLDHLSTRTDFRPTPELAEYQFGGSWAREDESHGRWSVSANFGSASDKPFDGTGVDTIAATALHQYATSERTSWTLLLNYSNNRTFLNDVPLFGFVYSVVAESRTHGWSLGFPFVNFWFVPSRKLQLTAFAVVPSTLGAQVGYFVWGPVQGTLKAEWTQQVYLRHDRRTNVERIFYDQKRVAAGAKAYCGVDTFFEFDVAYVFDQSLYDGRNAYALSSQRLTLPPEVRLGAGLQVGFR